jgi:xyloglucan galactosyltransferase MUR3
MNTWHFSLFNSLFNRLRRSRRRTMDPSTASLFIIPYDLAMDGNFRQSDCGVTRHCSKNFASTLWSYLLNQSYFQRYGGIDHVLLWSLGHYHPWPYEDCNTLLGVWCKECAVTCYWMDPTIQNNHFVSVPFPSSYHWRDGIKTVPWDDSRASERNKTVVYLGGTQTLNPDHTKIRRAMAEQCQRSPDFCTWTKIAHSSTDSALKSAILVYREAVFCLCPPGDDPARKALFDIILSGCIPVIFHPSTLYNQYPWHFGETVAREISVNIPGRQVRAKTVQIMDQLRAIPSETIRRKQRAIALLAPSLQYSMPPLAFLQNASDETRWDPPFRDAVDVMLDGMAERVRRTRENISTGIPETHMTIAEWLQRYSLVST